MKMESKMEMYLFVVQRPMRSTLLPYTTLFRSVIRTSVGAGEGAVTGLGVAQHHGAGLQEQVTQQEAVERAVGEQHFLIAEPDRKSTRLNSSHSSNSYADFGLTKKN